MSARRRNPVTAAPPPGNWLCLYDTHAPRPLAPSRPAPPGIGFVLHDWPASHIRGLECWNMGIMGVSTAATAGIGFVSHVWPRRELASFRTFVPSRVASSRPETSAMAFPARLRQIGFVCTVGPAGGIGRLAGCWLLAYMGKLALFRRRPVYVQFAIILFPVDACTPFRSGANWLCFARLSPAG
jgi:hypothetical protein